MYALRAGLRDGGVDEVTDLRFTRLQRQVPALDGQVRDASTRAS